MNINSLTNMKGFFSLNHPTTWLKVAFVVIILGFNLQFAHAWVSPAATPPNGNIGLKKYVSDCTSFAAYGWADKNECLHDGRWHLVQSIPQSGAVANADLVAANAGGADIRVIAPTGTVFVPNVGTIPWPVNPARCQQTHLMSDGNLVCLDAAHYSGGIDDANLKLGNGNVGATAYKTNGIATCTGGGCGPYVLAAMDWYVKY